MRCLLSPEARRAAGRERWNSSFAQDACYYKLKTNIALFLSPKIMSFYTIINFSFLSSKLQAFQVSAVSDAEQGQDYSDQTLCSWTPGAL